MIIPLIFAWILVKINNTILFSLVFHVALPVQ